MALELCKWTDRQTDIDRQTTHTYHNSSHPPRGEVMTTVYTKIYDYCI